MLDTNLMKDVMLTDFSGQEPKTLYQRHSLSYYWCNSWVIINSYWLYSSFQNFIQYAFYWWNTISFFLHG